MKQRLILKLTKTDMRAALAELDVEGMEKKKTTILQRELRKFSYNEIVNALKL